MKPWAEKFYKSKAWQEVRQAYFIYRHGICERCGRPGEIVHHKEYLTPMNINNPNITLNWDNLELLCQDCHNKEHSKQDSLQDGLMFDGNGNLIQSPPGLDNSGLFRDRRAEFRKPRNEDAHEGGLPAAVKIS